jgi:hypothetical protein
MLEKPIGRFIMNKLVFIVLHAATLSAALCALPSQAQIDTSNWTREQDHQHMLQTLGISKLRPGRDGSGKPDAPNAANTDEALANPYPDYPALLVSTSGQRITTAAQWQQLRRPELVAAFENEVLGKVPAEVPTVTWAVVEESGSTVGGNAVHARKLVGHVDNNSYPALTVDIQMTVVTPANSKGPVPVLMMFGRSVLPGAVSPTPPAGANAPTFNVPPSTEQLIAAGWGYALLDPTSVQADNGAGLTKGIIGLVNRGQPRKPSDWGALRAWAWGAARGLDYLRTLPEVDSTKVGIEGVSRYGKAALVTHALESGFSIALIGSSGEGGVSPYRRNFGESVENLTGAGEYHWMAGNFLQYGADESRAGRQDANNLPIDSHMLIALCAPKPTFISYGIPDKGDALWLDQQGSYMATVAASTVFELLGVKGVGDHTPYQQAVKPAVNVGLLNGQLAWRQHDGGHEDRTNMPYFIAWANGVLGQH